MFIYGVKVFVMHTAASNLRDANRTKERKRTIVFFLSFVLLLILSPININAAEQIRSTSLHIVETEDDNSQRTDYVNDDGVITDAADKHYATIIKTKNYNSVLEQYFHADGSPAVQSLGHYALLRVYNDDGQNYKLTYLGIDDKPTMCSLGYSTVIRSFDKDGNIETEMYYDTENKPVETTSSAYGCFKEYDKQGNNICTTYLNRDNEPAICGQGFARIRRFFYGAEDPNGEVVEEFYFDQNDNPISLALGQFGIHKEYDDLGRNNAVTYLDKNGLPIVTIDGYSTIKKTFFPDDSIESIRYYDTDGKPVSLSDGQYGYRIENGETIYLDSEGNDLFNIKNYLYNHQSSVIIICAIVIIISVLCGRKLNFLLLFIYIVSIIYMTLIGRDSGITIYRLDLFWSYRQFFSDNQLRREIINNILLFMPLGTILYRIHPKRRILFFAVLLSILIELIQLATGTGWFEFDDVISNGIGALSGYLIGYVIFNLTVVTLNKPDYL